MCSLSVYTDLNFEILCLKIPFYFAYLFSWFCQIFQGIGTDEQVLVEILSSRSTKVSFGPCQLKQKIVMNLVHVSSPFTSGKDEVKFLNIGKKHVLKRLFWMTFIKTCLWLSVQLQEREILLEFCSLAFIWIEGNRSRNCWVLHDILDLKTGMLASLEKILQTWAMWTLRSLRLLGSLKKKKQFSDLYVYLKTTF